MYLVDLAKWKRKQNQLASV